MNKEQAERALEMGQQYLRANNPVKALRLFTKSKKLKALKAPLILIILPECKTK